MSSGAAIATFAGAVIRNIVAPGLGGILIGGAAGKFVRDLARENTTVRKRVFVCFDFDNDRVLKDFIVGQARHEDSPFDVIDHSLKEAAPERHWEDKARIAIKKSDIVLVMVGRHTYRAPGVLKEVKIAREEGISIVQIIGYKDGQYTAVPDAGRLFAWNWDNLKRLLS